MNCRDLRVSRRRFLQGIAAAATPVIVSPAALGAGKTTPPSERVTVGIIGIGKMAGEYHLPSLLGMADVQVVAVCEVDTTRRLHGQKIVESHYSKQRPLQGLCRLQRLPRADRPQGHQRGVHRHAGALARHPRHRGLQGGQGHLLREAVDAHHPRGQGDASTPCASTRVFQTGSQQRSNVFGQFREGGREHPQRPARTGEDRHRRRGRSEQVVRSARGAHGAGPGLGTFGWGRRPAALQFHPQPAEASTTIFRPGGAIASMPAAAMPTSGAHHYDIVQWGLGMDNSGPVEIIPPERSEVEQALQIPLCQRRRDDPRRAGRHVFSPAPAARSTSPRPPGERAGRIVKEPLGKNDMHLFSRRGIIATGSIASARGSNRWPTWRSAPAR